MPSKVQCGQGEYTGGQSKVWIYKYCLLYLLSATEFSTNHRKVKQANVQQMSSLLGIKYKACPPVYSPWV